MINIDYEIDPAWAKNNLKAYFIQGLMNPDFLLKMKKFLDETEKF